MEDRYLFKAKRIDNGEWVQGYYVKGLDVFTNCEEAHIIFEPNTMFYSSGETDGWYKVDLSTICQCTGLKDMNGNLIWENDVVKEITTINFGSDKAKVSWIDSEWMLEWKTKCFYRKDMKFWTSEKIIEVIGNIFDNPELLQ